MSALVLNQPLFSGNLWATSPGHCFVALFDDFPSGQLLQAEAGGVSEPRLKTLVPPTCWLPSVFIFLTFTSVLAFPGYLFGREFNPPFLESVTLPLPLHLGFSRPCSSLPSSSE